MQKGRTIILMAAFLGAASAGWSNDNYVKSTDPTDGSFVRQKPYGQMHAKLKKPGKTDAETSAEALEIYNTGTQEPLASQYLIKNNSVGDDGQELDDGEIYDINQSHGAAGNEDVLTNEANVFNRVDMLRKYAIGADDEADYTNPPVVEEGDAGQSVFGLIQGVGEKLQNPEYPLNAQVNTLIDHVGVGTGVLSDDLSDIGGALESANLEEHPLRNQVTNVIRSVDSRTNNAQGGELLNGSVSAAVSVVSDTLQAGVDTSLKSQADALIAWVDAAEESVSEAVTSVSDTLQAGVNTSLKTQADALIGTIDAAEESVSAAVTSVGSVLETPNTMGAGGRSLKTQADGIKTNLGDITGVVGGDTVGNHVRGAVKALDNVHTADFNGAIYKPVATIKDGLDNFNRFMTTNSTIPNTVVDFPDSDPNNGPAAGADVFSKLQNQFSRQQDGTMGTGDLNGLNAGGDTYPGDDQGAVDTHVAGMTLLELFITMSRDATGAQVYHFTPPVTDWIVGGATTPLNLTYQDFYNAVKDRRYWGV